MKNIISLIFMNPTEKLLLISFIVLVSVIYAKWSKEYMKPTGKVAGWLVMVLTIVSGVHFIVVLVSFVFLSLLVTQVVNSRKYFVEQQEKINWARALAIGTTGTIISLTFAITVWRPHIPHNIRLYHWACFLLAAFIGHYASLTGVSWAAQLNSLAPHSPVLITTLRKVPRGTHGAVSILGCVVAIFGGFSIAAAFCAADVIERIVFGARFSARPSIFPVLVLGILSGFMGYLIDALIGATLQFSGWSETKREIVNAPGMYVKHISGVNLLSSNGVIFLSTLATSVLAGVLSRMFLLLELTK